MNLKQGYQATQTRDTEHSVQAQPVDTSRATRGVVPADPLDTDGQLEEMKRLEDGWADGMQHASGWGEAYGKAPSAQGLDRLKRQFANHYHSSLPRPYLYPTPEGGAKAEWSLGASEASLEIDLESLSAEWFCLDMETGISTEETVNLDEPAAWERLKGELMRLRATTR